MKQRILIALLLLVCVTPVWAIEQAGQVIFVAGTVTVQRAESLALKKTDLIYEGDVITTAERSRGQLLMKDGAKFSLRPGTEFAVEEYFLAGDERDQPDGAVVVASNNGAVTSLLKGGFRTISGAIGKVDPDEYVVKSPAATMGIRGTHYSAVWCSGDCPAPAGVEIPDGLYVGVTEGVIAVTNATGEYTMGAGEYYYVQNFDASPVQLPEPPGMLGDSAEEEASEEESTEEEAAEESSEETAEGSSDEAADESSEEAVAESSESGSESEAAASDDGGAPAEQAAAPSEQATQSEQAAAEVAATATAIGASAASVGLDSSGSGGPSSGGFSARSVTPPGQTPGGAPGSSTGSPDSSSASDDDSSDDASDDSADGSTDGSSETQTASATTTGSSGGSSSGSSSGSSTGSSGSTGGSTSFGGAGSFGGGPSFGSAGGVGGSAPPSEPPIPVMTTTGGSLDDGVVPSSRAVAMASGPVPGLSTTVFTGSSTLGSRTFSGNDLTAFQSPPANSDSLYAIGTASVRDDGFDPVTGIGWGRWRGGTATITQTGGTVVNANLANQSLHWVYGPDTGSAPVIPITGTANYTLIAGNTDPTDTLGNSGALGSASLFANFTNATVETNLSLAINGSVWQAFGAGTITNSLFNGLYNSVFVSGQAGGSGNFNGFFGSPGGNGLPAGAGLTYGLTSGAGSTVSGAVVFGAPSP